MVAALPKATTATLTPQQEFANIYGNMVNAERALEVTAHKNTWRRSTPLAVTGWNR
jgi:hypothetical protein